MSANLLIDSRHLRKVIVHLYLHHPELFYHQTFLTDFTIHLVYNFILTLSHKIASNLKIP